MTFPEPPTLFDDYSTRHPFVADVWMKLSGMTEEGMNIAPSAEELAAHPERTPSFLAEMNPAQRIVWHKAYDPRNRGYQELKAAGKLKGKDGTRYNYQRYIRDTVRCIDSLDENVGRILAYLDETGLSKNTIVVYASDQGFFTGEHGWAEKRWMYEESFKFPLLIRWPGKIEPGTRIDALVQNIDLAPTLLTAAGVPVPKEVHGLPLQPVLGGKTPADWRKDVLYTYYDGGTPVARGEYNMPRHMGVRDDRYKLISFYDYNAWELYDLKTDPQELDNVYEKPEYAKEVARLKERLAELKKQYQVQEPQTGVSHSKNDAQGDATAGAPAPADSTQTAMPGKAGLRVPSLFGDQMILQQKMKNTIWGWATPGEKIAVRSSWGASASTQADAKGRWKVLLDTPSYGTGFSLKIIGSTTIEIKDVAIGEVWLCAGQSNMGWSVGNSFEAEGEASVNLPNLRIFKSSREHWHEPLEEKRDRLGKWKPCTPEVAADTSAVSYYFGKKLHEELGIPIGIIQQAYAGTPIEGWMPWDVQKEMAQSQAQKADFDKSARLQKEKKGESMEKAIAAFNKDLADYNAKIEAGETMKNKNRVLQPPSITKPADLGNQYPAHIFNAMIYPIRPYGIKGALWYQGERNSKTVPQAIAYRDQLERLISCYRSSWHELSGGNVSKEFPFFFTQLPSWNPEQTQPVEGIEASWAANREMMRLVSMTFPNTAMAVSIDTGDSVSLHPKNKKPIGIRHAYLALKNVYGKDIVSSGPRYLSQKIEGNTITLTFDSVGSGMMAAKPGKLDAFAIAGADKVWHWADAEISGDKVIVSSKEVQSVVAVRYAWAMNPSQRNLLYNKEGLPASPFRTDDWPLFDPNDPAVEVEKPERTDESRDAKRTGTDWARPRMTQ
jgi:sialate O-acetylesterase